MGSSFFFKKKIKIQEIFPKKKIKNNFLLNDIKPLSTAEKNDLTFFDSIKYQKIASQTKASICITTLELEKYLPDKVERIIA